MADRVNPSGIHRTPRRPFFLLLLAGLIAAFPGRPASLKAQARQALTADFVLACWYDNSNPAGTFRSKAYDTRQRGYDPRTLEAWKAEMKTRYPGATAYLLGVSVAGDSGLSEETKLAAAIARERNRVSSLAPTSRPAPAGSATTRGAAPEQTRPSEPATSSRRPPTQDLAGSRWAFDRSNPAAYEFLEGGKLRHRTTTRVAEGGWEQNGTSCSLWVGPSRDDPEFTFKGTIRGDRLEGVVRSRMFPESDDPAIRAIQTAEALAVLERAG